jgi:hypothetical protein
MWPSKGGNERLDQSGPLHGVGGGRRCGRGMAACEEAVLRQCMRWRKREAGRAGGAKGRVGWLVAGPIGLEAEKNSFGIEIGFLN